MQNVPIAVLKLQKAQTPSKVLASQTSWWQGIAEHRCQQNILKNFRNCFQILSLTRFKQLDIILINVCQWLTRTRHMLTTTNSLVVHSIVSLRSWKIHHEKLYFSVLVNWMLFQHHCFLYAWMQYCLVMNHSLLTGEFPLIFKTAIVKPLLKKISLDSKDMKNYRPVSNLSFMSKVLLKESCGISNIATHKLQ